MTEETEKLSRRQFVKVVAAGLGLAAIPKPITKGLVDLASQSDKPEEEKPELPHIETPNATFYPLYERHDERVPLSEIQRAGKLDLFFFEFTTPASDFIKRPSSEILEVEAGYPANIYSLDSNLKSVGPVLREEVKNDFFEKNTYVGFEGTEVPSYIEVLGNSARVSEMAAATALNIFNVVKIIKDTMAKKDTTSLDLARNLAGILAAGLTTPDYLLSAGNKFLEGSYNKGIKRIMTRIGGTFSNLHPEDHQVFLRNLLMAEKLMLLGEELPNYKTDMDEKTRIAFEIGARHAGIEDVIKVDVLFDCGRDFVCKFISLYPPKFLQEIVAHNGGIDAFCSTVVVPVKDNLEGKEVKYVIKDEKLKSYLENILGPQKKAREQERKD